MCPIFKFPLHISKNISLLCYTLISFFSLLFKCLFSVWPTTFYPIFVFLQKEYFSQISLIYIFFILLYESIYLVYLLFFGNKMSFIRGKIIFVSFLGRFCFFFGYYLPWCWHSLHASSLSLEFALHILFMFFLPCKERQNFCVLSHSSRKDKLNME